MANYLILSISTIKYYNIFNNILILTTYNYRFIIKIAKLSLSLNFFLIIYQIILYNNWEIFFIILYILYKVEKFKYFFNYKT